MKHVVLYLLIVVTGFGFAEVGSWWIPVLPCFVICAWKSDTGLSGFLIGGLALLTLWLGYALLIAHRDTTDLASKIGELFNSSIPALSAVSGKLTVFLLIGLVSFLLGGLSGFAGVRAAGRHPGV